MIKWKPQAVIDRMQKALLPEQSGQSLLEQLKARARQVGQVPSKLMQRK